MQHIQDGPNALTFLAANLSLAGLSPSGEATN
jgi:hypothetical protein